MKILRCLSLPSFSLALTFFSTSLSAAADVTDLPVKVVDGRQYYYYNVKAKETIYSLSRELKVTKADIFKYNPAAEDGLKIGQELIFPVDAVASYSPATGDAVNPATHNVAKGETMFGISRKYGITPEQIMTWNPATRSGLKSGMVIYVSDPSVSRPVEEPQTADGMRYVIRRGETLFQIAQANNTTVEEILSLNPGLDGSHYSAGQTIALPTSSSPHKSFDSSNNDIVDTGERTHLVKDGETLYSIARAHGMSVKQIEDANPGLGIIKKGMVILLPVGAETSLPYAENTVTTVTASPLVPVTSEDLPLPDFSVPTFHGLDTVPIKIAVALPFMTTVEERPKSAQLFTEFYRGMMLAVDSLRNQGRPVYVYAYDTNDRIEDVRNLLSRPEMKEMSVIIAPDNEDQLREFAFFGRSNNVPVLNTFVVKDNSFRYNRAVIQCNIPHRDMYSKAIKEMTREFVGATPVILNCQDGADDKSEYIAQLRQELDSMDIRYLTIDFKGRLTQNDLGALTKGHRYVFIPSSGRQTEFTKIAPALIELKESRTDGDEVRIFGYPEWVTFRGDALKQLHTLNTSIYSRFYSDSQDSRVSDIESKYTKWYGSEMGNYIPSQGLLGFDLGMFVVNMLRAPYRVTDNMGSGDPTYSEQTYDGVQNGYHLRHLPNAGSMNDLLYIVTFRPSGVIERRTVR